MDNDDRKILFLAHSQSVHVQKWVNYFVQKQWDVHVVSFHPFKIKGTTHHYIKTNSIKAEGNNFQYILNIFPVLRLIKQIQPQILNSHFLSSFGVIGFFAHHSNHIINTYGTDVYINSVKNPFIRYLCKKALYQAKHVVSVSDKMASFMKNTFSVSEQKITTRQYGIDLQLFKKTKTIESRPYDFIINRLFVKNSNYNYVLECMKKLKEDNVKFRLLIVGSGPLKEKILSLIREFDLKAFVTVMDAVPPTKMAKLLNSAKIFLSFTSSDGTPLSLFEAMACGLYPILSNIDAYKEWQQKGMVCELVPLNNSYTAVYHLKQALIKITKDNYEKTNYSLVNKYMDYNKNMAQMEQLFRNLIS